MQRPCPDANLLGVLYERARTIRPSATALVDGETGDAVTYAELGAAVATVGNRIRDHGVESGDRVALLGTNSPGFLYALFGIARLGAVPVPVNVRLPSADLTAVLDDCSPSLALVDGRLAVDDAVDATSNLDGVATLGTNGDVRVPGPAEFDVADAPSLDPTPIDPADTAMISYTSGSSGRPKGVLLSNRGLTWNNETYRRALLMDETERALAVTPLYHKNAMSSVVKPMLASGGSFVLLREFDAAAAIDAIERYDVTYTTGVPATYRLLLDELDESDAVDGVTWGICGSSTVTEDLLERFRSAFDAPLLECYGLTEGGTVVCQSPRWGVRKPGSCGLPLPGCETLVVDTDSGEALPMGEMGELLVSNPGVGRYLDRPEATDAAFTTVDGTRYLRTGDLAYRDEQGYHYVVGRLDDMLIVGGENLHPSTVESILADHPDVADVAVVGHPHATKGEAPVAFVVADGNPAEAELQSFALDRGPAYAHPRRVLFETDLPLGGSGKVDRDALTEMARERLDGPL